MQRHDIPLDLWAKSRIYAITVCAGVLLLAPPVFPVSGADVLKEPACRKLADKKSKDGLMLEVWDTQPGAPWRIGENRRLVLRLINASNKGILLPLPSGQDTSRRRIIRQPFDHFFFAWLQRKRNIPDGRVYLAGRDYLGPLFFAVRKRYVLKPRQHIDSSIVLTPTVPGRTQVLATFENGINQILSEVLVPHTVTVKVTHPDGTSKEIEQEVGRYIYKPKADANIWRGKIWAFVKIVVDRDVPKRVRELREETRKILDDADATNKGKLAAFRQAVTVENWHSVQWCFQVLKEPKWNVVHESARSRLIELANKGLLLQQWDTLATLLHKDESWRAFRIEAVPLLGKVAKLQGSIRIKDQGSFFSTKEQTHYARRILKEWADGAPSLLSIKAKRALREVLDKEDLLRGRKPQPRSGGLGVGPQNTK